MTHPSQNGNRNGLRAFSGLAKFFACLLVLAYLAPVVGAGAVLADDLRDVAALSTGLADNPDTPGPDLMHPRDWGRDIPDMPSLVVAGTPSSPLLLQMTPLQVSRVVDLRVCRQVSTPVRGVASRGPPSL
jgi:hypothetical protein